MTQANAPIGFTFAELWGAKYVIINDFKYDRGFVYVRLVRSALDTWWSSVRNCYGHVTRCKSGDAYIIDGLATQRSGDIISCQKIGRAFTSGVTYVFIKGVTNNESIS